MKLKKMFAFIKSKKIVAAIEAKDKEQARERVSLVTSWVQIPDGCKVKAVPRRSIYGAPIFFDEHLQSIEDILADA